ncbi:hypothetical protein Sste5346_001791 [Sporothrix stenoceras]|uniref:Uncharacterized protein n=1 Tax=Sporothrix stenoceras TaxID=5173 RepID=A0ABR3ZL03_9PEZI
MPSPDQLHLPNPAGQNGGQGQQPGNNSGNNGGPAVPSAPGYYTYTSPTVARHYARPPGASGTTNGDWSSSYATLRMPPPEQPFTDDMQDLQARGKDPYEFTRRDEPYYEDRIASLRATERRLQPPAGAAPIHHLSPHYVRAPSPGPQLLPEDAPLDDFANLERRRHATAVLDSPELLMMYAQSLNDSIPAVRMTFMRIMCGYDRDTMLSPTVVDAMDSANSGSSYGNSMGRRQTSGNSGGGGGGSNSGSRSGRRNNRQ